MTHPPPQKGLEPNKKRFYKNGKLYFSKKTERNFFFYLTLVMLLWGILAKLELF